MTPSNSTSAVAARFTNLYCEACGRLGDVLSADGWNTCVRHFLRRSPSWRRFDRTSGEPLPLPEPPPSSIELVPPPSRADDHRPCRSFHVGHRVHWIQGLRSVNGGEGANQVPCEITDVTDDGWFTLVLLDTGERKRRWHHSVLALRSRVGRRLCVHEGFSIIRFTDSSLSSPISISGTATPCVFEEPTGQLHEQLETHGGFSIPGPEALRLMAETAEQAEDSKGEA